ncbi:MAG: hypothetical protein QHH10_10645 [Peptococcaceae bacterium]|nr:hypothetical protein [Peptococcaceae bacterium]MDH7525756.1 hypothetical protein [Peptococcaceae bacterium]
MDRDLTKAVKEFAYDLGADVVGIASVDRWQSAPLERSPQGIMPGSKAAVVCGFHYLDSCVELGGNLDVRIPGPALSNHIASEHGNFLAFKLAKFLQDQGWRALMVPATVWWSYRPSKSAPRGFAADLTHYYAAVAAGLGEIGWNNICLTPEFGPRQRLVTVITDAPLVADPLYSGPPLCDKCLLCAKKCPMQAFDKEVDGMLEVDFGEKKYSFPNKNLWRCSAGENFNLDVFAPWPEKIDEQTIEEFAEKAARTHPEWRFSWKMGMCLKYCVPRQRRYFDPSFSPSPRRRRDIEADTSKEGVERASNEMLALAKKIGVDYLAVIGRETLLKCGIDLTAFLPTASSAIVVGQSYPRGCAADTARTVGRNALWLAKHLQNRHGFDTVAETGVDRAAVAAAAGFSPGDKGWQLHVVVSSIPFADECQWKLGEGRYTLASSSKSPDMLTGALKELVRSHGADLFGVTPVERLDAIADQLEKMFQGIDYFYAREMGWGPKATEPRDMKAKPANPVIHDVKLTPKRARDYLASAQSVLVIGLGLLKASVENAGKPPAFKAAHYAATVHKEAFFQNESIALQAAKFLADNGFEARIVEDLEGLASQVFSNLRPDLKANRFPAIAAGLGELGWNGLVLTPEFGPRQRFIAVVTDAVLSYGDVYRGRPLCTGCKKCVTSCPVKAISEDEALVIKLEGREFRWGKPDILRCDWAARYGLVGEEGPAYMGSLNNFYPPPKITRQALLETIKKADKLQRTDYCPIVERCFTECPAT